MSTSAQIATIQGVGIGDRGPVSCLPPMFVWANKYVSLMGKHPVRTLTIEKYAPAIPPFICKAKGMPEKKELCNDLLILEDGPSELFRLRGVLVNHLLRMVRWSYLLNSKNDESDG
jgi:hypothetical protein